MTIKYALREETPEADLVRDAMRRVVNRYKITPVPQAVAEADSEDGVYGVFNSEDQRVSAWIYITNPELQYELDRIKPGKPLADRMGTMLAIGDYALTTFNTSHHLCLVRVVGFTPSFVRIQSLQTNWSSLFSKSPDHLVKVPDNVIPD